MRVSTKDQNFQNLDLQIDALRKQGCAKIYEEFIGGAKAERPILGKLLANLRAGDILVI